MSVTSLVQWRTELVPGEPFRVPAQWIMPHSGDFWGSPKHVTESVDPRYGDYACLGTHSLTPTNEHLARHWVYSASPGDTHVWHDEDRGDTIHFRYLGVYRVWGLTPNDWLMGTLGFTPERQERTPEVRQS